MTAISGRITLNDDDHTPRHGSGGGVKKAIRWTHCGPRSGGDLWGSSYSHVVYWWVAVVDVPPPHSRDSDNSAVVTVTAGWKTLHARTHTHTHRHSHTCTHNTHTHTCTHAHNILCTRRGNIRQYRAYVYDVYVMRRSEARGRPCALEQSVLDHAVVWSSLCVRWFVRGWSCSWCC